VSKLFAGIEGSAGARPVAAEAPLPSAGQPVAGQSTAAGNRDAQDRKAAFVTGGALQPTVNSGRLTAPAGRYVISAGSTIAAALITGLSSDLPGEVVAQVTENVFDSATGRILLIPQGARLIGRYDAHVSYGQERALVVWTRLILPDGRSIDLDRMIGTDPSGQSGFADRVDHHTGTLFKAALLSTLFGLGAHIATGGDHNDIAYAIRDSAGQSVDRAGDKLVGRQPDVPPTITVRPGARVRVLVERDLLLDPWSKG
jgi:type IV secretion system protein VirB10